MVFRENKFHQGLWCASVIRVVKTQPGFKKWETMAMDLKIVFFIAPLFLIP